MANCKLGDEMWKKKWSTRQERWDKEKIWLPDGNKTHDRPNTWRTLYPLSHESWWRVRSFTWVNTFGFQTHFSLSRIRNPKKLENTLILRYFGSVNIQVFRTCYETQTPLAISLVVIMVSNKASYVRKSIAMVVTVTPWAFLCTYLYHLCRLRPNLCLLKN